MTVREIMEFPLKMKGHSINSNEPSPWLPKRLRAIFVAQPKLRRPMPNRKDCP